MLGINLGIENTKALLGYIFIAISSAFTLDKNGDGKVSVNEAIMGIMPLAMNYSGIATAAPEAVKEARDYTPEEIDELVLYVQDNFDLPDGHDRAERLVKRVINAAHYNYHFFRDLKAEFKGETG